jgi:hypothetical protein
MFQGDFQYTPVDSIAIARPCAAFSQSTMVEQVKRHRGKAA